MGQKIESVFQELDQGEAHLLLSLARNANAHRIAFFKAHCNEFQN